MRSTLVTKQCLFCPNLQTRQGAFFELHVDTERARDAAIRFIKKENNPQQEKGIAVIEDSQSKHWFVQVFACLGCMPALRSLRLDLSMKGSLLGR